MTTFELISLNGTALGAREWVKGTLDDAKQRALELAANCKVVLINDCHDNEVRPFHRVSLRVYHKPVTPASIPGVKREIVEGLNGRGRRVWIVQGPSCEHEVFETQAEAESWLRYAGTAVASL